MACFVEVCALRVLYLAT